MKRKTELPKRKRGRERGKITAYPDFEIQQIYERGRANGWDTAQIARDALTAVFKERREELLTPADEAV